MAKVKVKLFGVYRMDTHLAEATLEAEKLSDLLKELHAYILERDPGTRMTLSFRDATVYINGEKCTKSKHKLSEGDEVWLLSPASGG